MKIRALAVAALLWGCGNQVSTYSSSSGSLALSNDDALLYAVDSDSNQLFVINAGDESLVSQVKVGKTPEKVIVGPDDTIYVTNRMERSVSIIKRGDWKEANRLATGVEPAGLAFTSDGKTLLVVNATMLDDAAKGSLMGFDTATLQKQFEIPVGAEPRGVAVSGNNVFVSLFKDGASHQGGDVITIDLSHQKVVNPSTDLFSKINLTAISNNGGTTPNDVGGGGFAGGPAGAPPSFNGQVGLPTLSPRGIGTLTVSPDGRQVIASTLLSSSQLLPSTSGPTTDINNGFPGSSGGDGYGAQTCGAGAVASPALLTFDSNGNSLATDATNCQGQHTDGQPAQILVSGNPTMPIQGPSASAVDPTGAFLFVVGRNSNNVAILPMNSGVDTSNNGDVTVAKNEPTPGPTGFQGQGGFIGSNGAGSVNTTVAVGAGPSGIALSHDGKTAWVHNAFDHSISRLERKDNIVQVVHEATFTTDVLPQDVVEGRKLFFTAVDSRMTAQTTGIACESCHLEGREDGHVWNFTDGPRQTPSLAGRMTMQTLPLHWNGEFDGLTSFMAQTVNHRMGGTGVTDAMEKQIQAFIGYQALPDNPHKTDVLSDAAVRGAQLFQSAGCATCHLGQALTDNGFHMVGTELNDGDNSARLIHGGFNTPSLIGIARTAPYLHNGKDYTLMDRLNDVEGKGPAAAGDEAHGNTNLTEAQKGDLVEFLKTL
jgi:YVTN family beta-propeller protein